MSDEQSDSSKKSTTNKTGIKQKVKDFSSKKRVQLTDISSKAKNQLSVFYSDKIIHQEVYVDGKEPKSYSFHKKFWGLYGIFIVYSLLLISAINFPDSTWINILMLGNPFVFSNAIVTFFLALSILLSIDKLRIFIFEKKTIAAFEEIIDPDILAAVSKLEENEQQELLELAQKTLSGKFFKNT